MEQNLSDEQRRLLQLVEEEVTSTFLDVGDVAGALRHLETVRATIPEDDSWNLLKGALDALSADCHFEGDDLEEAVSYAESAHERGWFTPETQAIIGWDLLEEGEPEKALSKFNEAISLDPDSPEFYYGRALAHMQLDENDQALADCQRTLELDDTYPSAYLCGIELHFANGDEEEALRLLEKGRSTLPKFPPLALIDAQHLAALGKFDAALDLLRPILTLDSDDEPSSESYLLAIELLLHQNKLEEAKTLATKATNLFADDPFAFIQLAATQLLSGKNSAALKAAERSVELDLSLPDAFAIRAAAHFANKAYEAGFQDLERFPDAELELPLYILGVISSLSGKKALQRPFYQDHLEKLMQEARKITNQEESGEIGQTTSDGANPFAGVTPGMFPPGFNPAVVLNQMFDSEGNVRPMFKPIIKMALKSAPSLAKTIPPHLLAQQNIDPKVIEQSNLDNLSDAEFDKLMRMFYQTLKNAT